MKVYRGLSLGEEEIDQIKVSGDKQLKNGKGSWLLKPLVIDHHNLPVKEVVEQLLSREEGYEPRYNRDSENILDFGKYVTGQMTGAIIYSNNSQRITKKDFSVVLEIQAEFSDLIIDGRDSLYLLTMKMLDGKLDNDAFNKLGSIYGEKLTEYYRHTLELSPSNKEKIYSERDRLTDFICMDLNVIQAHHENTNVLIQGRYGTMFQSAFGLLGGINAENIVQIHDATGTGVDGNTSVEDLMYIFKLKESFNVYDY